MSCPYFDPVQRRTSASERAAMLPLGDSWSGVCRAAGAAMEPDEVTLNQYCSLGYARGCCGHFPEGDGPDAVRFHIASDDGELRIRYVVERNHHPYAHGIIAAGASTAAVLDRQANAYAESYRWRKHANDR